MPENATITLLRLHRIPGIGPINARKLVGYFGSAEAIFNASGRALLSIPGMGHATVQNLLDTTHQRAAGKK